MPVTAPSGAILTAPPNGESGPSFAWGPSDLRVYQRPLYAGGAGVLAMEVLSSGISLAMLETGGTVLVGADLQVITTVAIASVTDYFFVAMSSVGNAFYVMVTYFPPGTNVLYKVSDAGVILQTWTPGPARFGYCAAVGPDEVLYYQAGSGQNVFGSPSINQLLSWDLATNGPQTLHSLAPTETVGASTYHGVSNGNFVIMADGLIVRYYTLGPAGSPLAADPHHVIVLTPAGAIVTSFSIGGEPFYLWQAGDGTSFWVSFPTTTPLLGVSRFERYRASDGTLLARLEYPYASTSYPDPYAPSFILRVDLPGDTTTPPDEDPDAVPPVCCTPDVAPGETTPGDTPTEDTSRPLPPWIRACLDGGTVPTAADIIDAESWA